jgi:hypothetical protein
LINSNPLPYIHAFEHHFHTPLEASDGDKNAVREGDVLPTPSHRLENLGLVRG